MQAEGLPHPPRPQDLAHYPSAYGAQPRDGPTRKRRERGTSGNPTLLFVLSGLVLFRFATRQLFALLFQLPPRITRFEPDAGRSGSLARFLGPTGLTHRSPGQRSGWFGNASLRPEWAPHPLRLKRPYRTQVLAPSIPRPLAGVTMSTPRWGWEGVQASALNQVHHGVANLPQARSR